MSAADAPWGKGYVQVYTGDGKGKTTAALGLALRAAGAGAKVYLAQFAKAAGCSELAAIERFGGQILVSRHGSGTFIRGEPSAEDAHAARAGLREARRALVSGDYQLVILDEANVATYFGLFPVGDLLDLIDARPGHVELVITGRRADPAVVARADLVTEMRQVRHYGERGVAARKGIEY